MQQLLLRELKACLQARVGRLHLNLCFAQPFCFQRVPHGHDHDHGYDYVLHHQHLLHESEHDRDYDDGCALLRVSDHVRNRLRLSLQDDKLLPLDEEF